MALVDNAWYVNGGAYPVINDLGGLTTTAANATIALSGINVPAGSLIVFVVNEVSATASGTLSDGGTNTYTVAKAQALGGATGFLTIFYAWNCNALTNATLTYTKQTAAHGCYIAASYTPHAQTTSDPLDATFTTTSTGTTTPTTCTSGTPAAAGEIVYGIIAITPGSPVVVVTQPTVWSMFGVGSAQTNASGEIYNLALVNNSTAPVVYSPTFSGGTATGNAVALVGFKSKVTFGGYWGVTVWTPSTVTAAGTIIRNRAVLAVGNERCFVCVVAGTTNTTEPTWTVTRGAKTTDNTVTWQECTGIAALNGDLTNTVLWSDANIKGKAITLGQVIQRVSGASYQICTTAGTAGSGSEPAFSNTAGTTTADNTVTWTSLGAVANFNTWKAPHARLANAAATNWGQAGNNFYVASAHAEVQTSALTLNVPGTTTASSKLISVNAAGSVPPVVADIASGASISTTGNSAFTFIGDIYVNGVTLNCGSGVNAPILLLSPSVTNSARQVFENCTLARVATGIQDIKFGTSGNCSGFLLKNTSLKMGTASDGVSLVGAALRWVNSTAFIGSNLPSSGVFEASAGFHNGGTIEADGVDFSALPSGTILVGASSSTNVVYFRNCKLPASYVLADPNMGSGSRAYVIDSDSGALNYKNALSTIEGNLTTETTIVRTAGATDGTTPFSWKCVTTTKASRAFPAETLEGALWNGTTGSSKTLTFHCVTDNVTLQDADIWVEVEYLGSSSAPLASPISSAPATIMTAGANLATESGVWTTTGLTTPIQQKFSVSFTPQLAGPIRWKVKVAKPSTTVYVDPNPDLA